MIFAKLLEMAEAAPIYAAGPSGNAKDNGRGNNLLWGHTED